MTTYQAGILTAKQLKLITVKGSPNRNSINLLAYIHFSYVPAQTPTIKHC